MTILDLRQHPDHTIGEPRYCGVRQIGACRARNRANCATRAEPCLSTTRLELTALGQPMAGSGWLTALSEPEVRVHARGTLLYRWVHPFNFVDDFVRLIICDIWLLVAGQDFCQQSGAEVDSSRGERRARMPSGVSPNTNERYQLTGMFLVADPGLYERYLYALLPDHKRHHPQLLNPDSWPTNHVIRREERCVHPVYPQTRTSGENQANPYQSHIRRNKLIMRHQLVGDIPIAAPKPTPIQPSTEEENQAASRGIPIRGISSRGSGQGMIYASPDGRISMHAEPTAEPITRISPPHSPPASPRKGLSRLWSRSRKSVDESTPKPVESQPSEPPVEAPVESESHPTPSSPTAKHTKVPLKDKVMGTLEFIGKIGYGL
ncbi:hypothetical protein AG1IA_07402 [Rhizoctonia solani AG-1 IA]|uniref:Uncharacterized protein n=1 Tax=Thanatephorus cucumeris (strain AG1-IA) TaxID=983506 RepID=L8WQD3_THACA|nr:hypothetical protein AG1IA_07402 [Rhizoctonia solani AG-1 IA]